MPERRKIIKFGAIKPLSVMNRESLNRILAIVAIVCGIITVSLLVLTAPDLRPQNVISWRFIAGFLMIAIGIFVLRVRRK